MRSWRWTLPALAALAWTTHCTGVLPAGSALAQQPLTRWSWPSPLPPIRPKPNPRKIKPQNPRPPPAVPLEAATRRPTEDAAAERGPAPPVDGDEPADPSAEEAVVEVIKERYPNGTVKVEREITQDAEGNYVLHGAWRQFDEQGRLIIDGRHEHNLKIGLWRKFYRGSEAPLLATAPYKDFTAPFISQANFHNGQLHGKWMISDSKQRKVHEIEFCDGQRHGKARGTFPTGPSCCRRNTSMAA